MHESLWDQNENAPGTASQVQAVQDEQCLNGLAQTHFICQQHAGHQTAAHFASNKHLVRDEIHPATHVASHRALAHAAAVLESLDPQIIAAQLIHLPGSQPVFGLAEADGVRQFRLWEVPLVCLVHQQAVGFLHAHHREVLTSVRLHHITLCKADTAKGGGLQRILAGLCRGREEHFEPSE